jgi:ABC-type antimicrobial peptide transport system permease subunit
MAISLLESVEIGLADIWTRKIRTIVTVVGIVLGVMSIMVVLAIVTGMNKSTLQWMQERGGLNKIEVHANWSMERANWAYANFTLNEIKFIRSLIPEAKAFTPVLRTHRTTISKGELAYETSVSGVYPDMTIIDEWNVQKGRFINYYDINNNNNVIVLGSKAAEELFANRNPIGEYVYIQNQALMVIGIMQEKYLKQQGGFGGGNMLEHMNRRAFLPLTTMLHKITPDQKIDQLTLTTYNPDEAVKLRTKLQNIILNLKQGRRVFEINSAKDMMDRMKQNSMIFTVIFVLIAVISLLVGGIVIMNIMLASIQERTREIGVRLAIGARRIDIFVQFMVQAVLITTMGGVIGIVLGFGILDIVGKNLELSLVASMQMIGTALLVSVGVGLVFGVTPAIRASNLNPVTALRNE